MRRGRLTTAALAAVVGPAAARAIVARFGGRKLPTSTERLERNLAICAELDAGATYADVAERYGVSRAAVAKIASRCSLVGASQVNKVVCA